MSEIMLLDFPMPPSENAMYRNREKGGRCATKALLDYRQAVQDWVWSHQNQFHRIRKMIPKNELLRVGTVFCFPRSRIFTKDGRPKRLDTSNRIKAIHDEVGKLLEIDDSHIWDFFAMKMESDDEREFVIVMIETLDEAKKRLVSYGEIAETPAAETCPQGSLYHFPVKNKRASKGPKDVA